MFSLLMNQTEVNFAVSVVIRLAGHYIGNSNNWGEMIIDWTNILVRN